MTEVSPLLPNPCHFQIYDLSISQLSSDSAVYELARQIGIRDFFVSRLFDVSVVGWASDGSTGVPRS